MYFNILLATDLTDASRTVARKAWELANQFDAKLSAIYVIEPISAYGYPGIADITSPHIAKAKERLHRLAKELMLPKENLYVEVGATKTEILKKAEAIKADLIVVGGHGRHGLTRLLGATANAVIHGATCDVITIRYKE